MIMSEVFSGSLQKCFLEYEPIYIFIIINIIIIVVIIKSPRYTGGDLMFSTGSYAAGRRFLFTR